jgi:hypothetical protein
LGNQVASSVLKVTGPGTVRWLRSGTAPEVRDVTFDVKPSGAADWTRLGTSARISGGWELSGLTLPASCQIRAQGYAGGSVMESVASFPPPIESWRLQFFGTADNTGEAADDADPDHDGLTNFTEFAFGLNPVDRAGSALPEFKHADGSFTASFTAPEGRDDILYSAEWSPDMRSGTWTGIPETGMAAEHRFSIPAGEGRVFVRFALRMR